MEKEQIKRAFAHGKTALGIELGSTKIKAVLLGEDFSLIASGAYDWKSTFENGVWTYSIDEVWTGLQAAYKAMADEVFSLYGEEVQRVGCIGFSAMMHGYLPFDGGGKILSPFRTWQNTTTAPASAELSELFSFNIPQRWSIAHLYQSILNGEEHVKDIRFMTTLAGYVHWRLTGERLLGVGDASGMFPITAGSCEYDKGMLLSFNKLISDRNYPWTLEAILPKPLSAGEGAGVLTDEGARLLDPSGRLCPGIPLCPPEGDAGTGMAATNSVAIRTGNVSAGTSIFSMVVLERALKNHCPEIDVVATPDGMPVAMVHCNNCTNDMNAWVSVLGEFSDLMGAPSDFDEIYPRFYKKALEGEPDCGGIIIYNYMAGEPVSGVKEGRPMVLRRPDSHFTLGNFCRASLYGALATLKIGMDILAKEDVTCDRLTGHGGLFRHGGVGARFLAAATGFPVCTMETAAVGGPYGMALLALYYMSKDKVGSLEEFLEKRVFADARQIITQPDKTDAAGFAAYMDSFKAALPAEAAAGACLQ